jgi:phosphoglycerate dehydrogenase-like enzyme
VTPGWIDTESENPHGGVAPVLPVLFFDTDLPEAYSDLVEDRAIATGPGPGLDQAVAVIAGARIRWDAARFALAPKLLVLSRTGIGYDNVDVAAATAAGVVVCNAPAAPTVSTAEHAIALLLAVTKQLPSQIARARLGLTAAPTCTALELDGATLGLIGLGRIAARVAAAAQALGMRVVAHDPFVAESLVAGVELAALETVVAAADVLSLHAPASEATHHLVGPDLIAAMKPGAYLVNTARGSLVDQVAILDALDRGHLAGVALDVTEPEPLPVGHPLLEHERVIVTPHVASSTAAGRRRLYQHAIDNALAVLAGQPATIVNPPVRGS